MNNNFKTFFRRDSSRGTSNITSTVQLMLHFNEKAKRNPITGYILVSLGVLLSASSGSWDITNHLLNRPETFFSPPHAGLYLGVAIVISGSIIMLRYYRSSSTISNNDHHYIDKLMIIKIAPVMDSIPNIPFVIPLLTESSNEENKIKDTINGKASVAMIAARVGSGLNLKYSVSENGNDTM